jgi:hypothetical protein
MAASAHFESELVKRIETEIERLRDVLEAGQDIDITRGRLVALRQVIGEYLNEVNENLEKH